MNIAPIDLIKKDFARKLRGYDPSEVDAFLAQVAAEYEKAIVENARLLDETKCLGDELERYRNIESTMNSALVLAQKTADELRASARKEAELTIREAKESIEQDMTVLRTEHEELRRAKSKFLVEFRTLLSGYADMCRADENGGSPEHASAE